MSSGNPEIPPTTDTNQPQSTTRQPKAKHQQNPPKSKQTKPKSRDLATVYQLTFPNGTPKYVDTHCHLDFTLKRLNQQEENTKGKQPIDHIASAGDGSTDAVQPVKPRKWDMQRLVTEGYLGEWDGCVTICCEPESFEPVLDIIDSDTTGKIFAGFGIHPHEASKWNDEIEAKFVKIMSHPKVIAWGECGLDYFYNNSPRDVQREVFIRQMELCVEAKKPLIVHTREAEEDTVELMTKHLPKEWPIHIHCCTSSRNMIIPLLDHFPNLYVGFTGCITFASADSIRDTLSVVPLNRLLLETDGPFMAPIPFRGMVAHSGMIPFIAKQMAEVKGVTLVVLMEQIRENTRNVYGF